MCDVCEPSWSRSGPYCERCPPGAALSRWSPVGLGFFIAGLALVFVAASLPILLSSLIAPFVRAWAREKVNFLKEREEVEEGEGEPTTGTSSGGAAGGPHHNSGRARPAPRASEGGQNCLMAVVLLRRLVWPSRKSGSGTRRVAPAASPDAAEEAGAQPCAGDDTVANGGGAVVQDAAELEALDTLWARVTALIVFCKFVQVPFRLLIGASVPLRPPPDCHHSSELSSATKKDAPARRRLLVDSCCL